ncbi:MAG: type II toxin-antitoxin system VapC family toxin, partial [Candidatus Cryptobacteroides sp.]
YTGRMGDGVAEKVMQVGECSQYQLCISILTGVNVVYVLSKFGNMVKLSTLSKHFEILPMTREQWEEAAKMRMEDSEDALQLSCARDNGCRIVVTRDRSLLDADIMFTRILSPEDFIRQVSR